MFVMENRFLRELGDKHHDAVVAFPLGGVQGLLPG